MPSAARLEEETLTSSKTARIVVAAHLLSGCGSGETLFENPNSTRRGASSGTPKEVASGDGARSDSEITNVEQHQGGGPSGDALPEPPPPELPPLPNLPPIEVPRTQSLFWSWACASEEIAPSDPNSLTIAGEGEFVVDLGAASDIRLEVAGTACKPEDATRDVVFVVDVSSSMRNVLNLGHDPLKNGRCERLTAVEAVLAELPNDARVAVVTFSDDVRRTSKEFLSMTEFRSTYATANVFCDYDGGTNYKKALLETEAILQTARPEAMKEVYFVSDGEPDSTRVSGLAEAARIRMYASIATLIVDDDDDEVGAGIASLDAEGKPLSARAPDASTMAATLAALQRSEARRIVVTVGATEHVFEAPLPETFRVDADKLRLKDAPGGVALSVEIFDSRGRLSGGRGLLRAK